MIEIGWLEGDLGENQADALIVGAFADGATGEGLGFEVQALRDVLDRAKAAGLLPGPALRTVVLPTYGWAPVARMVVVGLGDSAGYDERRARLAASSGARAARASGARRLATTLHRITSPSLGAAGAAAAVVAGMRRGLWRYDGYRTLPPAVPQVESAVLLTGGRAPAGEAREAVRRANIVADSVSLARELATLGSNDKYPSRLAERAQAYAAQVGLEVQVLDEKDLAEMGAGCILGVGQGSVHPPRMVVLQTPGARAGGPMLALVGKGITFDSGGISLKAPGGMEEMKYDMCGAAAVMTALGALARLGSEIPVIGIMCLAENLPGGSAQRPGDVVRSLDGQTVEVENTDAEGRLVMADGLALARRLGATHLVDVATLTGAVITALGHAYTGLMGNDEAFVGCVQTAARAACEQVWPLPIDDPMYEKAIESPVADMRNTGRGAGGGALTAATFLRRFAGGKPWVHLDIAGTAWITDSKYADIAGLGAGATGAMVETFIELPAALAAGR